MLIILVFVQCLYGKLFTVMGILWIFEILHFLLHGDHEEEEKDCLSPTELFFRALGVINLARGVLIFYIFVCKDSILSKVNQGKQASSPWNEYEINIKISNKTF